MGARYLLGKAVARRAFFRSFPEEPAAWVLEAVLGSLWENERPLEWYALLESAEECGLYTMMADTLLGLVKSGLIQYTASGEALYIPDDRMQQAMNIAGVWYSPYPVDPAQRAYRLTPYAKELLETMGLENFVNHVHKKLRGADD